jgi:hypothetical protein
MDEPHPTFAELGDDFVVAETATKYPFTGQVSSQSTAPAQRRKHSRFAREARGAFSVEREGFRRADWVISARVDT